MSENIRQISQTEDPSDFTRGSILKKMIPFMFPILGALLLQAAYGAVDLLVVGRFGTTAGLSGVSTGSQIMNLVTFVVTQLATGLTVLIGRYLGEKQKPERIGRLLGTAVFLFAVLSILLFIIMVGFARPIAVLMQAPVEAVDLTADYIRICGAGIFFIVAYNVLSAIFRGLGDSRSPLIFVAIACAVNVCGDLLLVAVFHMNVAGAAIATVAAQAVSVLAAVIMLRKKNLNFHVTRKDIRINDQTGRFLRVGIPLALQEMLTQISFVAICAFVNRLGLEASSGYGVACKIVNFAMLLPSALMQTLASFVSQNVGADNEERAKKSMLTGMAIGLIIGTIVFVLILLKGDVLTSIFTSDQAVVEKGFDYLRGFAAETIVTSIMFSLVGYFNGHEKTVWVMTQGILQTLLVRLPLSYFLSIQPDASLTLIGFASPLSTVFGIVLNLIYYAHINAKRKKQSE
jgi:putative MATE family efflux protein